MRFIKDSRFLIFLFILAVFSLFIGSIDYRIRMEEPTRTIPAFEMLYFKNFFQPTIFGIDYYLKPPFFNWLTILSSFVVGWNEFTGRFVSIVSTFLTGVSTSIFFYRFIEKNMYFSLLSGLVLITFSDILFWYGFLGEIDATLMFFTSLMIFLMIFTFEKNSFFLFFIIGLLIGINFLIKGFPSLAFFILTAISISIFYKKPSYLFNLKLWVSFFIGILIVVFWIVNTNSPSEYLSTLWQETFNRVKSSSNISKFFLHLIKYPFDNVLQMVPISLLAIFALIKYRFFNINLYSPQIKLVLLILLLNYLPYWISSGARGRYILPLLPLAAVFISYMFFKLKKETVIKWAVGLIAFSIFIRVLAGVFYLPYETKKKGFYKKTAVDIYKIIKNSEIATDYSCYLDKAVIYYLDTFKGKPVLDKSLVKNWEYLVHCKDQVDGLRLIKEYNYKNSKIFLYKR